MHQNDIDPENIANRVAGTMSLSGFILTDEDKDRIRELVAHPERYNEMMQALIEKHTRRESV